MYVRHNCLSKKKPLVELDIGRQPLLVRNSGWFMSSSTTAGPEPQAPMVVATLVLMSQY